MPNTEQKYEQNTGHTDAITPGYPAVSGTVPNGMDELVKSIASDPENLYRGIIYLEIFGKPKSKRRGRW